MNPAMDVLFGAYLGIEAGKICSISQTPPETPPATIIDGTGMVAMPGMINCHTHLATTVLRNLLDDENRAGALQAQLYKEDKMDNRTAKAAALLGIAECLRFGVTSVSDLYYFPDAVAEAAAEAGIKANIALSAYRYISQTEDFDFETDPQCQEFCRVAEKWNGYDNGRIRIDGGIHAPYTSNYQLWEGIADYCREKNLGVQLHLAETPQEEEDSLDRTGLGSGELLNCHRFFDIPATAAGCAALSDEERSALGKKKVSAVATPIASAKNGLPCTPIAKTVKAGMNVALGTGGAVECGNLDMFEVMRAAALAERSAAGNAAAMPASALLMMATVCGARAQQRSEQCGMLKVGMDADIALVDFSAPHLIPCHNVMNALVFSAKGGDVAMTKVRGKILYQNGIFPTLDLKNAVSELTGYGMGRLFAEKE
jgi:5-methylthioadenosine/S-adenosylhomocysteine deaminase